MNKKLIAALIAVILMAAMLCTSCGSSTPKSLAGTTWVCTYTAEQLKTIGAPDGAALTLTFVFTDETNFTMKRSASENGEVVSSYEEEETYTYKDGKFSINDGGDLFQGTVDGNTLTMEVDGTKYIFKKK